MRENRESRQTSRGKLNGAGDRDRTGDIQLGKLASCCRLTQNQAFKAGHLGQNVALAALIAHDSAHNFSLRESESGLCRLLRRELPQTSLRAKRVATAFQNRVMSVIEILRQPANAATRRAVLSCDNCTRSLYGVDHFWRGLCLLRR